MSPLQAENAPSPTLLNEVGSVRDMSPLQAVNASAPILVNEFESVRDVSTCCSHVNASVDHM